MGVYVDCVLWSVCVSNVYYGFLQQSFRVLTCALKRLLTYNTELHWLSAEQFPVLVPVFSFGLMVENRIISFSINFTRLLFGRGHASQVEDEHQSTVLDVLFVAL